MMPGKHWQKCAECGQSFQSANRRKFCSKECREKDHTRRAACRNRVCKECGKQFSSAAPRKYCSIECRAKAQAKQWGQDPADMLKRLIRQMAMLQDAKETVKRRASEPEAEPTLPFAHNHGAPVAWRCHDCGRVSVTYRCPKCKAKWLRKNGYTVSDYDD